MNPDLIYLALAYLSIVLLVARMANAAHRRHRKRMAATVLSITVKPVGVCNV